MSIFTITTLILLVIILAGLGFIVIRIRQLEFDVMENKRGTQRLLMAMSRIYRRQGSTQCDVASDSALHSELIQESDLDTSAAGITGFSRETWIRAGTHLLENILYYSNGMTAPLSFPCSEAAGYPRFAYNGSIYGQHYQYMEAYCRSLFLASSLLVNEPELRVQGRRVADYYHEYLLRGTDKYDSAGFSRELTSRPPQTLVEAATVCICLFEAAPVLWNPLENSEKRKVLSWLSHYKDIRPYPTNWCWFSVLINTFLKINDHSYNDQMVRECIDILRGLHIGSGWYKDGETIDYYTAWSMQFNSIYWLLWDGNSHPEFRDELEAHSDAFLNSYAHVFSRDATMPVWGRSICYRFAATSPFAVAFKRERKPDFDPGFGRFLCSGNLRQFTSHPDFLKNGLPSLGFYGENSALVDNYSCVASPLLCTQTFLALTLPATNPFWAAPESRGFWQHPPSRYEIAGTGIHIDHNAATGHSRTHIPSCFIDRKHCTDPRYQGGIYDTAEATHPLLNASSILSTGSINQH